jgi:hypothetical protein
MVTHGTLLAADQVHAAPVVTATEPLLAEPPTAALVGLIATPQTSLKANGFEGSLRPLPIGPTAVTRAS